MVFAGLCPWLCRAKAGDLTPLQINTRKIYKGASQIFNSTPLWVRKKSADSSQSLPAPRSVKRGVSTFETLSPTGVARRLTDDRSVEC